MENNPSCPICSRNQWEVIGQHHYARDILDNASQYDSARYEVLFDVWFPGTDMIELRTVSCKCCGFVMYIPRPSTDDIHNKYNYLNNHPDAKREYGRDLPSDKRRSRELYKFLARYIGGKSRNIVDFGGGKGRLLHEFLEQGHQCGVVDYVGEVIPGATYLGRKMDDLPPDARFDLVICSHVIEHLADPLATVVDLAERLASHGYLYIEVPNEIWKGAPPKRDPVTHINFFTPNSLRSLMERAGLNVLDCRYATFTRPNGKIGMAIKAIGRCRIGPPKNEISYSGSGALTALLHPTRLDRVMRVIRHPRLLRNLFS